MRCVSWTVGGWACAGTGAWGLPTGWVAGSAKGTVPGEAAVLRGLRGGGVHREVALGRRADCVPPTGCLDALSLQGQFTFTADQPQLHCAAFLIAEPGELLTVQADHASLDCQRGDFLKVRPHPLRDRLAPGPRLSLS